MTFPNFAILGDGVGRTDLGYSYHPKRVNYISVIDGHTLLEVESFQESAQVIDMVDGEVFTRWTAPLFRDNNVTSIELQNQAETERSIYWKVKN